MFLEGKTAIVTGTAQGIGRAIAIMLAEQGAEVACLDTQMEKNQQTAEEAGRRGPRALAVECDVADPQQVKQTVARLRHDLRHIDILINNAHAHTASPLIGADYAKTIDDFDRLFATNAKAPYLLTLAVLPSM